MLIHHGYRVYTVVSVCLGLQVAIALSIRYRSPCRDQCALSMRTWSVLFVQGCGIDCDLVSSSSHPAISFLATFM